MFVLLCTWYFFDFVLTHALCHLILAHLLENRVDVTVDWPSMHPILRLVSCVVIGLLLPLHTHWLTLQI